MNIKSLLNSYPQLVTLKQLVSDELIVSEIGSRVEEFEADLERAKIRIPTVNLNRIFPSELEKGCIQLENFLGHWGNVSIEELCKICLIVKYLKPRTILEIGTYNGMTTLQMALNAPPDAVIYTLDLADDQQADLKLSQLDEQVSKHFKSVFGTKTGKYFSERTDVNIVQKLGDSAKFDFDSLGHSNIDLIFIDAAHDYHNKKIDSENAFKYVSKGGVILWHNYHDVTCPDVTKYLADISERYKLFHLRNTSIAGYYNL